MSRSSMHLAWSVRKESNLLLSTLQIPSKTLVKSFLIEFEDCLERSADFVAQLKRFLGMAFCRTVAGRPFRCLGNLRGYRTAPRPFIFASFAFFSKVDSALLYLSAAALAVTTSEPAAQSPWEVKQTLSDMKRYEKISKRYEKDDKRLGFLKFPFQVPYASEVQPKAPASLRLSQQHHQVPRGQRSPGASQRGDGDPKEATAEHPRRSHLYRGEEERIKKKKEKKKVYNKVYN